MNEHEKDFTLGEFLRTEREKRGISIEQVASATKVGIRTLQSLENDLYTELPALPFVRGFVTSYCRFINLDPKEILTRYDDFLEKKSTERPNREGGHSGYAFEKKDGQQQSRTILIIAIITFIVLGGLAVFFLKPSLQHKRRSNLEKLKASHQELASPSPSPTIFAPATPLTTPSPLPEVKVEPPQKAAKKPEPKEQTEEESSDETDSPEPAEVTAHHPSPSTLPTNPTDPLDSGLGLKGTEIAHKLVFKTLADVWVRYQVDDRPVRKFIVRKGKTLILRGKSAVKIQVSNPSSVQFQHNGTPLRILKESKSLQFKEGTATLIYPPEQGHTATSPFQDSKPLPKTEDPQPLQTSPKKPGD